MIPKAFIHIALCAVLSTQTAGHAMASNIDSAKPQTGNASTANVRANFAAAKAEIETLQANELENVNHRNDASIHTPLPPAPTPLELVQGIETNSRTFSPNDVREMVVNFAEGADPAPDLGLLTDGSVAASEIYDGGLCVIFAHLDDEILWMLPTLYYSAGIYGVSQALWDEKWEVKDNYPSWLGPRITPMNGLSTHADILAFWGDQTARLPYYDDAVIRSLIRQVMVKSGCQNFVAHNPWGEYGHAHHRQIAALVEELAVDLGKSYWFNEVYIPDNAGEIGDTYFPMTTVNSDYVLGQINSTEFLPLRQVFLDVDAASSFMVNTWTWGSGPDDYPEGTWRFLRRVNEGVLDTSDDAEISAKMAALPVFGVPSP